MINVNVPARSGGRVTLAILTAIGLLRFGVNLAVVLSLARWPIAVALIATFVLPFLETTIVAPLLRRLGLVQDPTSPPEAT